MELPEQLRRLLRDVPELAQAYLVGGCVRDALLGIPNKDFDLEVYGVSYEALETALRPQGRVDLVGKSFGVVKFSTGSGAQWDFSVPRRDSKVAAGHKGFRIEFDPTITPREAASRRDFTINAIMFDPRTGEHLDFFDGRTDLQGRVLRHTSPAFVEDPLRVLRGMQFAARFELTIAAETVELCRSIAGTYPELAVERVGEEWFKWAAKARRPSAGLQFLKAAGWLRHFPEIAALDGTPQDPEWHPEGDVFTHTGHCCDALAELTEWQQADQSTRLVLMFAVLAHDFAKPQTTHKAERDGRPLTACLPGRPETMVSGGTGGGSGEPGTWLQAISAGMWEWRSPIRHACWARCKSRGVSGCPRRDGSGRQRVREGRSFFPVKIQIAGGSTEMR